MSATIPRRNENAERTKAEDPGGGAKGEQEVAVFALYMQERFKPADNNDDFKSYSTEEERQTS